MYAGPPGCRGNRALSVLYFKVLDFAVPPSNHSDFIAGYASVRPLPNDLDDVLPWLTRTPRRSSLSYFITASRRVWAKWPALMWTKYTPLPTTSPVSSRPSHLAVYTPVSFTTPPTSRLTRWPATL